MSRNPRHRPRKPQRLPGGEGGQLRGLSGDPHPDKNEPGARTMVGRGLGLDDRDIPGGLPHLVNPESPASKTIPKEPRPLFDGLNAHGVEDPDPELGYTPTPTDVHPGPRSAPVPPEWEDAVPVRMVERSPGRHRITTLAADGPMTLTAGEVDPQRIFSRDPERGHAYITNETPFNVGTAAEATGSRTSPGAGVLITGASLTPVPGLYQLTWSVSLEGTVAAATDANNFQLISTGGITALTPIVSENPGAVGEYIQPGPILVSVPSGSVGTLQVKSVGAGTASSVYGAEMILTPVTDPAAAMIRVGTYEDVNESRGLAILPSTGPVRIATQDALWVAPDAGALVNTKISWAAETQVPAATG